MITDQIAREILRDFDLNNEEKPFWNEYAKTGNVHAFANDPFIEECLLNDRFEDPYKKRKRDKIWWLNDLSKIGPIFFSFDLLTVYNLWSDYPWSLSAEQKAIFDKENPYWVDFFSDRQNITKEEFIKKHKRRKNKGGR